MSPMKRGGQAVMEQERPMDDHDRAPWGDAHLRDRLRCPSRGLRHDDSGGAHSITTAIAVAVAVALVLQAVANRRVSIRAGRLVRMGPSLVSGRCHGAAQES